MSRRECLPDTWVERIWSVMRATYGAAFDRQWSCPVGADPVAHVADMRAHWAAELGVYAQRRDAIRYALENLPAHPPNLVEFKATCNRCPAPVVPALAAAPADPARVAQALASCKPGSAGRAGAAAGGKAWALRLREREARGDQLSRVARESWREALRLPADAPAVEVQA